MASYRTRVNQPERVFLNSNDDITNQSQGTFSQFQIQLATPILGLKRTQLLRTSIPNVPVNPSIPAYCLMFWYYKLPTASTPLDANYLTCIRVIPAGINTAMLVSPYNIPQNQYLSDPSLLVGMLNAAAAATDDTILNPWWDSPNDVNFFYNAPTRQILFKGTDATKFYVPAGYADPILAANYPLYPIQIAGPTGGYGNVVPQPYVAQYNMNLRVGYAQPGSISGVPAYTPLAGGNYIPVDSYPNLSSTQCVYFYTNIAPGSALGSNGSHNLLAVVPINSAFGGVTQYTVLMSNWLTKVASEVYEIKINMLDDAQQPFVLPDNAQVNCELGMYFRDD